ncbi:hypothetical protein HRG_003210 [Hirsutella rhossiliensis]|uniref:Uncharacterized protein n=1 Tax=Hirsutella rhossiliensis TaxID=111463 RepID=A0A9P8SKF7_9HYPO|nr:uncharacterized protein HRG_03210 [Hirsutella rhossiliensis]KAH0965194.1 hypothetical protein HRG_03210 [Hirsutella rhossiliensis]
MSRFFPHAPYAEDQPLARTILTTHVATRAVTTGTILGVGASEALRVIRSLRGGKPTSPTAAPPGGSTAPGGSSNGMLPRLLRPAATGSLVGVGLAAAALALRMRGREPVEWQDRSWRLLANRGQVETDDWTYAAMAAAAAASLASARGRALGLVGVVGALGLGSVGGMVGYLAWRHGVLGGRVPDAGRDAIVE